MASTATASTNSSTSQVSNNQIASLPSGLLLEILTYLPLSSRSHLACCGNKLLYDVVDSFHRNLLQQNPSTAIVDENKHGTYTAHRGELMNIVREKKWLPKKRDDETNTDNMCHLRRLTKGDHLSKPESNWYHRYNTNKYSRLYRYYHDAKIMDDHYWVLYNDYWYSFEIFDLDTRKGIDMPYLQNGPDKNYCNDEEERISLVLTSFHGGFGMLAAAMDLWTRDNPHGAWSGPYLTIWDIPSGEVLMSIDLYKPEYRIGDVCIVSKDKVCILLVGDKRVELQWHKIPHRPSSQQKSEEKAHAVPEPLPDKPGKQPSMNQCTINCSNFFGQCPHRKAFQIWQARKAYYKEQDERMLRREAALARGEEDPTVNEKPSYESRCDYPWWPVQTTLIQENKLTRSFDGSENACMTSDGLGLLVVVVEETVQVWHVGTMDLVRTTDIYWSRDDFDQTYNEEHVFRNLTMHTIIRPFNDMLGPGEGAYYNPRAKEIPDLQRSKRAQGSKNYIDLTTCDTLTLLSRFAHLTYDEQRQFEVQQSLEEGSCSPQLDCIVRIAFSVKDTMESQNMILLADLSPFEHMRHRECCARHMHHDDIMEEELEQWEDACNGKKIWPNTVNYHSPTESRMEQTRVFAWQRGGVFDYEGGPSDTERRDNLINCRSEGDTICFRMDHQSDIIMNKYKAYNGVLESLLGQRSITCLAIDEYKLVVGTKFEVAVLPYCLLGAQDPVDEGWQQSWMSEQELFCIEPKTPMFQSFRPFDEKLLQQWNIIRMFASDDYRGQELEHTYTFESITSDCKESFEQEKSLMKAAEWNIATMPRVCISWRYIAMISTSLSGDTYDDADGYELLHVWDVLANQEECHAEGGIHFRDVDGSDSVSL